MIRRFESMCVNTGMRILHTYIGIRLRALFTILAGLRNVYEASSSGLYLHEQRTWNIILAVPCHACCACFLLCLAVCCSDSLTNSGVTCLSFFYQCAHVTHTHTLTLTLTFTLTLTLWGNVLFFNQCAHITHTITLTHAQTHARTHTHTHIYSCADAPPHFCPSALKPQPCTHWAHTLKECCDYMFMQHTLTHNTHTHTHSHTHTLTHNTHTTHTQHTHLCLCHAAWCLRSAKSISRRWGEQKDTMKNLRSWRSLNTRSEPIHTKEYAGSEATPHTTTIIKQPV